MFILEIKLVEEKENTKKYTKVLEAELEQKNQEIRILKERNAAQEREIYELREDRRVGAAEREKLELQILKTERQNIKLLCEVKSLRKISSEREKYFLNKTSETEMKYLNLKKQNLSETKAFMDMYR